MQPITKGFVDVMVKLTVDYDNKAEVWYVKTSDLLGVHAEGETLDDLCSKLPVIVSDLVEANRNQDRKPGTCYCSFCGKSQHEVPQTNRRTSGFHLQRMRRFVFRNRGGKETQSRSSRQAGPRNQARRTQTTTRRCGTAAGWPGQN